VKHARMKQGRVLVVPQLYGGWRLLLHSTEPASSSPYTMSLSSLTPSHGCGRCVSRVAPVPPAVASALPWALVVQGALFCVGASTPVRLVGMGCVHRPPAAPSCLAGALGACDRVCECMYVWVGRPGTPTPHSLGPVLHATACAPRNLLAVCVSVCLGAAGVCAWHALVTHTDPRGLACHAVWGLGVRRWLGGEVSVASALQLPCWSGPGGDGATNTLTGPVRS
jgi:hypothetical protein